MSKHSTIKSSLLAAAAISCLVLSPLTASRAEAETLEDALEATYLTNPALKAQREALAATDEVVAQAISEWRPTVSADYLRGRQKIAFGGSNPAYTEKEAKQLTVRQPLFNSGGSVARLNAAKLQVLAGREQLRAVEQDIMLQAVTAYMDVVRDEAVLELSGNNVGVLQQQRTASEDRFEVGEVTRTDVSQSRARLSRAESEQAQSEGSLIASQATYKRITGVEVDELVPPARIPALPETLDEAIELALAHNPELQRALYREEALKHEIWRSKSALLPSATLEGAMRREEGAGIAGGSQFDNDTLTVNVSIPLYQAGAASSQVRQTKQNHQEAKYTAMDARNLAVERMTRAWQGLQTAQASIRANESAIEAAEIALDGVKQEQKYGARTVLDVLDAEQELFVARVNLVRSKRNEMVAAYTVLSVLGWLTPERLELEVPVYNPEEHYDHVKYLPFGF